MLERTYNVYLVGQITANPSTFEWRIDVETFLRAERFKILNPCSFVFAEELLKKCNNDNSAFKMLAYINKKAPIIPHRDYNMVLLSDIAIANMNIITPEKPMLGSFFELAWYFAHPEKTVIGIASDRKNMFHCNHPFVTETVKVWVKNHIEATELIKEMF
jgi:nucleoside 2-deoxyribosyltransferase